VREVIVSGFKKFKNGEFDVKDKERSGRPKMYEDAELEHYWMKICANAKRTCIYIRSDSTNNFISFEIRNDSKAKELGSI